MMRYIRILRTRVIVLLVVLLVAGCQSVTSRYPLGPPHIPQDKEKLEGTWYVDKDAVLSVKFSNYSVARVAGVEWKNDQFQMIEMEMIATEKNNQRFLSGRVRDNGIWENRYFFAKYTFSNQGDLIYWLPNFMMFEAAIKKNQLQGAIEDKAISITSKPDVLLNFITAPENTNLFEYNEPKILRKVGN